MGVQGDAVRCPKIRNKLQGWALTSGFSGLLAVHEPRQTDDDKERKNGRLRKVWGGQVRRWCLCCSTTARTREGDQARKKKLLTASDIYLSMLLLKAHQTRHQLHRQADVRTKAVAHHDDGWDGDGCVLGKFFDLPDYGIGIRKAG